jgi:transcriptional regulator with XRE-family HTH domain
MGPRASEGGRILWSLLRQNEWTFAELARRGGVPSSLLNRWMHGDRLPDVTHAARIEERLGVPCRAWAQPWVDES